MAEEGKEGEEEGRAGSRKEWERRGGGGENLGRIYLFITAYLILYTIQV